MPPLLQWTRRIALTGIALHALAQPADAIEYRQLTTLAGVYDAGISTPEWSPDGTRIAFTFSWVDPGHGYYLFAAIGIVQVADGGDVPFSGLLGYCSAAMDGISSNPSWSPAGDRLAYDCGGGLMIGSVNESTAAAVPGATGSEPSWSPEVDQIAYAGTEPRRVTDDPSIDASPTWSPDGQLIAFASDRGGNFDIWVVRVANGKVSRVTTDPATDVDPDWSPDGSQIAFSSDRSGYANIWIASDLRAVSVAPASWSQFKQLYR